MNELTKAVVFCAIGMILSFVPILYKRLDHANEWSSGKTFWRVKYV